jgi:hypothetical protein
MTARLESALLSVPHEEADKLFRNTQKELEKEILYVATIINSIPAKKLSAAESARQLDVLASRLHGLKLKVGRLAGGGGFHFFESCTLTA